MYNINDLLVDNSIYNSFIADYNNIKARGNFDFDEADYSLYFINENCKQVKIKLYSLKDEDIEFIKTALIQYQNNYKDIDNLKQYFLELRKQLITSLLINNKCWRTVNAI